MERKCRRAMLYPLDSGSGQRPGWRRQVHLARSPWILWILCELCSGRIDCARQFCASGPLERAAFSLIADRPDPELCGEYGLWGGVAAGKNGRMHGIKFVQWNSKARMESAAGNPLTWLSTGRRHWVRATTTCNLGFHRKAAVTTSIALPVLADNPAHNSQCVECQPRCGAA